MGAIIIVNVIVVRAVHGVDIQAVTPLAARKTERQNYDKTEFYAMQSQKLKGSSSTSRDCMRQTQEDFQEAVNRRDRAEISRLLKNGFNINALNEAGDTPLHQCIRDGKTESAKLLVEFGADVKRTNRDGWSPAHLATSLGHRDLLLYLIMHSNER